MASESTENTPIAGKKSPIEEVSSDAAALKEVIKEAVKEATDEAVEKAVEKAVGKAVTQAVASTAAASAASADNAPNADPAVIVINAAEPDTAAPKSRKRQNTLIAAVIVLLLLLLGAFAWGAIQRALNQFAGDSAPGAQLHDVFSRESRDTWNKEVWVENTGNVQFIARLHMREFMQYMYSDGTGENLVPGLPFVDPDPDGADIMEETLDPETWGGGSPIDTQTPWFQIDIDDASMWTEYGTANSHLFRQLWEWQGGTMMTFAEWDATGRPGDRWVFAEDGYFYYSSLIDEGDETSLLMERVVARPNTGVLDHAFYYAIDIAMEVVSRSDRDAMYSGGIAIGTGGSEVPLVGAGLNGQDIIDHLWPVELPEIETDSQGRPLLPTIVQLGEGPVNGSTVYPYYWEVLKVDDEGNMLIVAQQSLGQSTFGAAGTTTYAGSNLQAAINERWADPQMNVVARYALVPTIPAQETVASPTWTTNNPAAYTSTTGARAQRGDTNIMFPLSLSEINHLMPNARAAAGTRQWGATALTPDSMGAQDGRGGQFNTQWTRTVGAAGSAVVQAPIHDNWTPGGSGIPIDNLGRIRVGMTTTNNVRPALWVSSNARAALLPELPAALTSTDEGRKFVVDGLPWQVIRTHDIAGTTYGLLYSEYNLWAQTYVPGANYVAYTAQPAAAGNVKFGVDQWYSGAMSTFQNGQTVPALTTLHGRAVVPNITQQPSLRFQTAWPAIGADNTYWAVEMTLPTATPAAAGAPGTAFILSQGEVITNAWLNNGTAPPANYNTNLGNGGRRLTSAVFQPNQVADPTRYSVSSWLRSPGEIAAQVSRVSMNGHVNSRTVSQIDGVRPAIWIR